MDDAIGQAKAVFAKPTVIIAHTIPGKGIEFTERRFGWHGTPPGKGPEDAIPQGEQGKAAIEALRTLGGNIKGEHE